MLTVKRVEAEVALLPLLQRRFELVRLNLVEPVIALETDAHGKGNWEFGAAGGAGSGVAAAAGSPVAALAAFGVGSVEVTNGTAHLSRWHVRRDDANRDRPIRRAGPHTRPRRSTPNSRARSTTFRWRSPATWDRSSVPVATRAVSRSPSRARSASRRRTSGPRSARRKRRSSSTMSTSAGIEQGERSGIGRDRRAAAENLAALASTTLSLSDLGSRRRRGGRPGVAEKAARTEHVFTDEPVSFAALPAPTSTATSRSANCSCDNGGRLDEVHARFTVKDGRSMRRT